MYMDNEGLTKEQQVLEYFSGYLEMLHYFQKDYQDNEFMSSVVFPTIAMNMSFGMVNTMDLDELYFDKDDVESYKRFGFTGKFNFSLPSICQTYDWNGIFNDMKQDVWQALCEYSSNNKDEFCQQLTTVVGNDTMLETSYAKRELIIYLIGQVMLNSLMEWAVCYWDAEDERDDYGY